VQSSLSHSVVIDMPRAAAWSRLRDLTLAHNYVPGLVRTELLSAQREGAGASRRVFQSATRWIDETVTEWHERQGFLIRLHRGDAGAPPPFAEASFRYWLEDAGEGRTRLTTTLSYTPRWGALGRWLDRRVLRKAVGANVRDVATGLKDFYERGKPVDAARRAELRAAERGTGAQ
jgi:hypothetical protein